MPMDVTLLFPTRDRAESTKTIEDVISFEVEHGDVNRVTLDQTDGRSLEYTDRGLTVVGGTETDDAYFD